MGGDNGAQGELRFSIEDLLYYAPRFIKAGQALDAAADGAERRLTGLGSFWGNAWPDRAFAHGYEPAQYAQLIIVKQLAAELEGIGGGIQLMARNYAISEADIQENIGRISRAAGRESALLRHDGGLDGPPPAPPLPSSPPSRITPNPIPLQSPAPVLQPTHAPAPGHLTPNPTPEASPDPAAWKRDGWSLSGPWPAGKPDLMDEAAAAWRDLAGAIDIAWRDAQRYTAYVMSDNQGAAANAFHETVERLIDPAKGALTHALQTCEQLQGACTCQAQAIRDLKHDIENMVAQLIVAFIIGQGVAMLTFQATQAASDAIDEWIVANIVDRIVDFVRYGKEIVSKVGDAMAEVIAKGFAGGGTALASAGIDLPVSNAISEAFGQQSVEGTKALKQILQSGITGMVGGAFTASASLLSTTLRNLSEEGGPASSHLLALSRQVKSGSITVAVANGVVQQYIENGTINPAKYASAVTGARLQTALQPHTGKHAR